MNIEPEIFTHPKFLHLEDRVGQEALKYLGLLWAHCQRQVRDSFWPGADARYVERLCGWRGDAGALFEALVSCKWIDVIDKGIVIHDWHVSNAKLLANWRQNPSGRAGKKKPTTTRKQPTPKPTDTPPSTDPQPNGSTTVNPPHPVGPPNNNKNNNNNKNGEGSAPFAEIPSVAEVVTFGNLGPGIPASYCRHYHERREITHSWLSHGQLIDWKKDIVSGRWWGRDKDGWNPKERQELESPALEKILSQLNYERDPKKLAVLRREKQRLEKEAGL